jgi:hypothetical protein
MSAQGGLTHYNGPFYVPGSKGEQRIFRQNCGFIAAQTTSGSGVIDVSWSDGTLLFSVTDWTNVQALYHEYRILAFKATWEPIKTYDVTYRYPPLITAVDHTVGGALTSYNAGATHESAELKPSGKRWTREIKATGPEEMTWNAISGAVNNLYIKAYGSAFLPVSTVIAQVHFEWLVELRGRT